MASTKIINVLKDDKFEDILDLFNQTSAQEVIFILPKKSRIFSQESHFSDLKAAASEGDKSVSLLCSNPETNEMARKYKFDVLLSGKPDKKPTLIRAVNQITDYGSINDDDPENPEIVESISPLVGKKPPADDDFDLDDEEDELPRKKVADDEDENPDELDGFGIIRDEESTDKRKVPDDSDNEKNDEKDDEADDNEIPLDDLKDTDEEEDRGSTIGMSDNGGQYEIVTAGIRRNLDDIVRQSDDIRNLRINNIANKPVKIGIKRSKSEKDFDKIKEVWDQDRSWDISDRPRRSLSFSQLFKSRAGEGYLPIRSSHKSWSKTSKITLYTGAGIVILVFVGLFVIKGNANISIEPYSTSINQQLKVSSSDKYSTVDVNTNRIPGQLIRADKTVSKTFDATGEKDVAQKARGIIDVTNNLSVSQPLVATTRFQNDAGLIFRTLKSINVPAGKSVSVEVIADKAGSNYNIAATTFVISSFKENNDAEKLAKVTGKSTTTMHGGTSGKAKVVTEVDYAKAKDALSAELKTEIEKGLKEQSANLKVITPVAIITKDPVSTAQIDEAADTFTMTLSGTAETIAFRESDLGDVLKSNLEKKGNVTIFPDKLEKNYSSINFDNTTDVLGFTVTVRGASYAKIDTAGIINDLAGKSIADAKSYLEKMTASKIIKSANVKLSLLWMRSLPSDRARIRINLAY